jgi:hypothetical protein
MALYLCWLTDEYTWWYIRHLTDECMGLTEEYIAPYLYRLTNEYTWWYIHRLTDECMGLIEEHIGFILQP